MKTREQKRPDIRVPRTITALKNALATLMINTSVSNISVTNVANVAKVNRGTFYSHYEDIDDLYNDVKNDTLNNFYLIFETRSSENIVNNPSEVMDAIFDYVEENSIIFRAFFGENGDIDFVNKINAFLKAKFFNDWLPPSSLLEETNPDLLYEFCLFGMIGVVRKWLEDGMSTPKENLSFNIINTCIGGLRYHEKEYSELERQSLQ